MVSVRVDASLFVVNLTQQKTLTNFLNSGRVDADGPFEPEGNLPDAEAGDDGKFGWDSGTVVTKDPTPQGHLRKTFYRMGFDDEAIVALSGAHTFGRAYKDRSGLGKEKTKFTDGKSAEAKQKLADGSDAKYKPGGSSWTPQWLVFDNSYFQGLPVRLFYLDHFHESNDFDIHLHFIPG